MAEGTLARLGSARARAAGIDVAPLMAKAGVTRQQIEEEAFELPAEDQIRFVDLVADALQDDLLGFHLACDVDLRELGLLYFVLNSSDFLGDALCRAERYCAIINEGVRLRISGGKELALDLKYVGVKRSRIDIRSRLGSPGSCASAARLPTVSCCRALSASFIDAKAVRNVASPPSQPNATASAAPRPSPTVPRPESHKSDGSSSKPEPLPLPPKPKHPPGGATRESVNALREWNFAVQRIQQSSSET
jgi:AraC-type transcriptional regulator